MIITVTDEWIGPISCNTGFFVQAWRGDLRVWWGFGDGEENPLTIQDQDGAYTVDLNELTSQLDGLVLKEGSARHFPFIPNQVIHLRSADGNRAIASLGQWPTGSVD